MCFISGLKYRRAAARNPAGSHTALARAAARNPAGKRTTLARAIARSPTGKHVSLARTPGHAQAAQRRSATARLAAQGPSLPIVALAQKSNYHHLRRFLRDSKIRPDATTHEVNYDAR